MKLSVSCSATLLLVFVSVGLAHGQQPPSLTTSLPGTAPRLVLQELRDQCVEAARQIDDDAQGTERALDLALRQVCNRLDDLESTLQVSGYVDDVEGRLTDLAGRIASIDIQCAPPFYANWNQQSRAIRRDLERTFGDLRDRTLPETRDAVEYRLVQLETSVGTQEDYARVLCGFLENHRDLMGTLTREREQEWTMSQEALGSLRGSPARVASEALSRFQSSHPNASSFSIYRAIQRAARSHTAARQPVAASGPRETRLLRQLGSPDIERFIAAYLSVTDARVAPHLAGAGTVRDGGRYTYQPIGDFVVQWRTADGENSARDGLADAAAAPENGPAGRYLSTVAGYAQDALVSECQRWLADIDVFEGAFLDATQGKADYRVRDRMRLILHRVLDGIGDPVAACRPGSRILPARLLRAFDQVYNDRIAEVQEVFARQYGQRFDRINWVGERLMDAIWLEGALDGAAPAETIDRWRTQYDDEYTRRQERREMAFQELERLRLANEATMALAQEESRRLIAIATREATARLEVEQVRLQGIRVQAEATVREAELVSEAALAEADRESRTALEVAELDFRARLETARTDLERSRIEAEAKAAVESIRSGAAVKKARIERKASVFSDITGNITSIAGLF